jgi:membrane dipeptidase
LKPAAARAERTRRALVVIAILAWTVLCLAAFFTTPTLVDRAVNRVHSRGDTPAASVEAIALHARLLIADLHADSLLWRRDLTQRSSRGHVDLPRLLEGRVAIQVFGVVTKVPLIPNLERNDDDADLITLLAMASRWPRRTWSRPLERALFQARRLRELAAASAGRLVVIERRSQLDELLAAREQGRDVLAALLGVEGAHALEGDVAGVERLFGAGVRMMSPSHFFDTRVGGSAHGVAKGGLSGLGRSVVRRMEELGMTIDLAHASATTIEDVTAIATRPVVVSHTGVRGTCDGTRNLEDRHVRAVAAGGGVIGIGYWKTAVCGSDVSAIARAVRYTADLVGHRHVALGSDFDGAVAVPFDASGLALLVDALLEEGFTHGEIADVMGRNVVRVLSANLPE